MSDDHSEPEQPPVDPALEAARTEANRRVLQAELRAAAPRFGLYDADDLRLADLSGVTLDGEDRLQGLDQAVAALREAKPHLFRPPETARTSHPGPVPAPTQPKPRHASAMSDDEYARARAEFVRTGQVR
jgi:hypothetical protein